MYHNKSIGIWGLGIVGKSAIKFFAEQGASKINVLETKWCSQTTEQFLREHGALLALQENETSILKFLQSHEYILASPGIDISAYKDKIHHLLTEADIFGKNFPGKIIAITGTVGKTTSTALLGSLYNYYSPTIIGGNIGLGLLELLTNQKNATARAVVELSSFQLEHTTSFAPDIAIVTNLYPNHLDRHITLEAYAEAKSRIFAHQSEQQATIMPVETALAFQNLGIKLPKQLHLTSKNSTYKQLPSLPSYVSITYLDADQTIITHAANGTSKKIARLADMPDITHAENWLSILSALEIEKRVLPVAWIQKEAENLLLPPQLKETPEKTKSHRLEKFLEKDGITFYDDSKSTLIESTLAALEKLSGNTILILGGVSKGVDRCAKIPEFKNKVKAIVCFGAEANKLYTACLQANITAYADVTLELAIQQAITYATKNDNILFSPAGASFDLFANYQERGKAFKQIVLSSFSN